MTGGLDVPQNVKRLPTARGANLSSPNAFANAVMAQQVFGGHGYIAEWGVEQFVRDVRIAQIYEGTNGVQALDLLGRKVLRDGGTTADEFIASMRADVNGVDAAYRDALETAIDRLADVTRQLLERAKHDPALAGAASVDYLDLFALTAYAWLWARMATVAPRDAWGDAKRHTAAFFYARLLPRGMALAAAIGSDSATVTSMPADSF